MDEDAVELNTPNNFCYVLYNLRSGPCREQLVLRLGRAVAIGAKVVTLKLKSFREDETLF